MSLAISNLTAMRMIPRHELSEFVREDDGAQNQALRWLDICDELCNAARGTKGQLVASIAARIGKSEGTINNKLGRYNKLGWRGLINRTKFPEPNSSGLPEAFQTWVPTLFMRFQRNNAAKQVHRYLLDRLSKWRQTLSPDHAIPGYSSPPSNTEYGHPTGWSYKNISRLKPSEYHLKQARQGNKSASNHLPSNYSTRVGLKFGQRVFFDDQDHDIKINLLGRNSRAMRPSGFNCIEHLSGSFLDYTSKMTLWDDGEKRSRTLKQKDFTWFVIHYLLNHGYRMDATGTELIFEHGSATGWKGFDEVLHHITNGHVKVFRGGRFNDPLFSGMMFRPQSSGNFRSKSPLESMFNLDRNHMASLPGQIGSNQRLNGMEEHYGMDRYNNQLIKLYHQLPEAVRECIQFPFLTWPEFVATQAETYKVINSRTDHKLEGWEKCGHVANRYRLDPSQPWMDRETLFNLDPERARAIAELADWRVFPLSPQEVVEAHRGELTKLKDSLVPLLCSSDWMIDVKVNQHHEIHVRDSECGSEPFIYIASIKTKTGRQTLDAGSKYKAYFHPICADKLWICDQNGAFIGVLNQFIKPTAGDTPAIIENQGTINAVKSDLNQWTERNLGAVRTERQQMVENNKRLAQNLKDNDFRTIEERQKDKSNKRKAADFGGHITPANPRPNKPAKKAKKENWTATTQNNEPTTPTHQPKKESW